MNIHEYQAKEVLRGYGVAVLSGGVAWTPEEAALATEKLPGPVYVVKSQIHAGGRGAGHFAHDPAGKGGVRLAKSPAEAREAAEAMIGNVLVTKQTGPAGRRVSRVYVEAGCAIERELYLSLLVDRETGRVTIIASTEGGMEIEHVAETAPAKILRVAVDPASGVSGFHARKLAFGLGLEGGGRSSLHQTYASESGLHERLRLVRGAGGTRNGFFLRAETMHGFFTYLATEIGGSSYHEMSHGESFLEAMAWYFRHPGFFCLDEPEAALSFSSTLGLIAILQRVVQRQGQVLCATHSPVLAALPGATILEVGEWGLRETTWDDLVLVANWRSYLTDPQRYLRHVLEP